MGVGNQPCLVKMCLEKQGKGDPSQELGVGQDPGKFSFWVLGCVCLRLFRFVCTVALGGSNWEVCPVLFDLGWLVVETRQAGSGSQRPSLSRVAFPQTRGALRPGMALRTPVEAGPQDRVCYLPERIQNNPQHLAAYYPPFPPYGHYGSTLTATEEGFQPFRQLEATASAAQPVPPFTFRTAPPLLSPGLTLQRESLYDLPWYSKLPPWYPISHLPREVPHFLNSSHEYTGPTTEDLGHIGGQSDSGQCCGPEILIPPPPVDASLLPEWLKTSQLLSCSPSKRSEHDPKLLNQEGKSSHHYHFTQEDLHLVLYGVIPSLEHSARLHHAISGLLVPTDNPGRSTSGGSWAGRECRGGEGVI